VCLPARLADEPDGQRVAEELAVVGPDRGDDDQDHVGDAEGDQDQQADGDDQQDPADDGVQQPAQVEVQRLDGLGWPPPAGGPPPGGSGGWGGGTCCDMTRSFLEGSPGPLPWRA
jgi:hypothetical protein